MRYRNNPANIRYSPINRWKGMVGHENGFCEFLTLAYGVRALYLLLRTYIQKFKLCDVASIINRFAPPSENNTKAYISYVDSRVSYKTIDFGGYSILQLMSAICYYETNTILGPDDILLILREFKLL